jgi:predicted ATPase
VDRQLAASSHRRRCYDHCWLRLGELRRDLGGAADALDLLSTLVDRSRVIKEDAGGQACYRLHETMREYARLRLQETDEQDGIEQRRAQYYSGRCRQSAREARYRLLEWFAWIELEIDNIRSVLQQSLDRGDLEMGIDLANSLGWYWITRAAGEGARWLDQLLATYLESWRRPSRAAAFAGKLSSGES